MVYENSSNFYWFNFWAKVILNNGPLSSFLSSPVCIWTIVENISRHSNKQKIKWNNFEKINKIKRSWFTQLRNLRSLPLLVFIIGSTSGRDLVKGACCVAHAHTHTHPHAPTGTIHILATHHNQSLKGQTRLSTLAAFFFRLLFYFYSPVWRIWLC